MDKWEYKRINMNDACGDVDAELSKAGQQGWEAVGPTPTGCNFLFKRKIPSSPTQQVQSQRSPRQEDDFDISF